MRGVTASLGQLLTFQSAIYFLLIFKIRDSVTLVILVIMIQVGRGCWQDVLWVAGQRPHGLPDPHPHPFLLHPPLRHGPPLWLQDPSSLLPG